MKQILTIGLTLTLFYACQKDEKELKRIDGKWMVELVRVQDGEGFTFYDSIPTGEIEIQSSGQQINGRVDFDYLYFGANQIVDSFVVDNDHFEINQAGDHLTVYRDQDTIDIRILLSSKKDLEFEYYDFKQYRLRRFSMHRI